jgi:hypothetical protein
MGFPTFRLFDKGNGVKRITGEIYQQMLVDTVWGI